MKIIEYSRAGGFVESAFEPSWEKGEDDGQWLARAGFELSGTHDGLESVADFREVIIHNAHEKAEHGFAAIVMICDGDRGDYVLVRTRAELLNLRMALTPWHALATMNRFDALVSLAEKAFCAWHEHEASGDCWDCDPSAMHRREGMRKIREAEKAKKASA